MHIEPFHSWRVQKSIRNNVMCICRWVSRHVREALFGKKKSLPGKTSIKAKRSIGYNVERWHAYRISCVRSASGELKVWRTIPRVGSRWRVREVACWKSKLSLHAIIMILSWQVYCIGSELWRHMTRKNQKIARSPHILGRLNACANSVYQALLRFSRAPGTRLRL